MFPTFNPRASGQASVPLCSIPPLLEGPNKATVSFAEFQVQELSIGGFPWHTYHIPPWYVYGKITIWLFNIAMENHHFY
jgi:hypothetical protein